MAEGLKSGAAIDHGAFVQILGDVEEEAVQHPTLHDTGVIS